MAKFTGWSSAVNSATSGPVPASVASIREPCTSISSTDIPVSGVNSSSIISFSTWAWSRPALVPLALALMVEFSHTVMVLFSPSEAPTCWFLSAKEVKNLAS